MYRERPQECALSRRQPVKFVERISPRPISQNIAIILDIALGHQFGQIDKFVRGYSEVEYLPNLCRAHRQWRPDVGGGQCIAHCVGAVVGPGAPVVVGFALGIFAVLVVQEGDNRVQHLRGYGQSRAKDRSSELQGQIGADTCCLQKVAKIGVRRGTWEAVKGDARVDPLGDRLPLDRIEFGAGQPLARCQVALKEEVVTRYRHPVDALEHCINTDPGAVFRIFHACCDCAAAPQSWERGAVVFAGALNIQDRVAWDASPFAGPYGAELARRAELNVIRKQLLVRRIWATLDDDISGFKSNLAMTPSWTQPPSRVANPMAAKASTRRTSVPPIPRSKCFIIWCSVSFGREEQGRRLPEMTSSVLAVASFNSTPSAKRSAEVTRSNGSDQGVGSSIGEAELCSRDCRTFSSSWCARHLQVSCRCGLWNRRLRHRPSSPTEFGSCRDGQSPAPDAAAI